MLVIVFIIIFCVNAAVGTSSYHVQVKPHRECDCYCSDEFTDGLPLCKKLNRFETELFTVKTEIERRTKYVKELEDIKERMDLQEVLVESLLQQIEDFRKLRVQSEPLATPASLVMEPEDYMLDDSSLTTRMRDDRELANNVSTLLAKVEVVENLTSKVQEELRSERRVRRHLEEDLNETRSSIKILDDKLQNVTFPMDSRVAHVEEFLLSTLDNINKTLFEEHLQKLYYKVDGVVYRNETKKLDERLDRVETDLLDVTNSTTVLKELKLLAEVVTHLNETVAEQLTLEESRIDGLESKTNELEELKGIDEQIMLLLNASELFQAGISVIWHDMQEVRNFTLHLEKEMHEQLILRDNSTEALEFKIAEYLQNVTTEVSTLKSEVSKKEQSVSNLQRELQEVAVNAAVTQNLVDELATFSRNQLEDLYLKIYNMTNVWYNSLATVMTRIIEWENVNGDPITSAALINEPGSGEYNDISADEVQDISNRMRGANGAPCSIPMLNDTHLVARLENDADGQQQLVFGCRPIGRYALREPSVPAQCVSGMWRGLMPSCQRLLDRNEVEKIATELRNESPCLHYLGDLPDPKDCNRFFKCWHGNTQRMACPPNLHFNPSTKRCDYPSNAMCVTSDLPDESERLTDLIPTVLIEPDTVDKPYGLMGTDGNGNLIVYPGTSFVLQCLFPENRWGAPTWQTDHGALMSHQITQNCVIMTVTAASIRDSGKYICRTPFGKQNSINVIVEAVKCPAIASDTVTPHNAFYRPHPDGGYRILSTSVQFTCEGGFSISAICQADGTWSRPAPTPEECPPKTFTVWGCPPIHTDGNPDLILERDEIDLTITFKCAGKTRLMGNAFTRCFQGSWTHVSLPRCVPRT